MKWTIGDTYTDGQWPTGVTEIVDGTGYVVALVPLHLGSARNVERRDWPKLIASAPDLQAEIEDDHDSVREVAAEIRKQDEALIRELAEALTNLLLRPRCAATVRDAHSTLAKTTVTR